MYAVDGGLLSFLVKLTSPTSSGVGGAVSVAPSIIVVGDIDDFEGVVGWECMQGQWQGQGQGSGEPGRHPPAQLCDELWSLIYQRWHLSPVAPFHIHASHPPASEYAGALYVYTVNTTAPTAGGLTLLDKLLAPANVRTSPPSGGWAAVFVLGFGSRWRSFDAHQSKDTATFVSSSRSSFFQRRLGFAWPRAAT